MTAPYRFGRFELRPESRQLLIDGQPAALGARAFDLLHVLIERRERLVTKNELLDVVWPGLVVEENNLQVQVSALRKVLGPQAIVTVPGRGYRFALVPASREHAAPTPRQGNKHNLPQQATTFVGREREIADVRKALGTTRLLTLVGTGGIGKTRLSLQVAADVLDGYPDGVWFVELAPLTDERMVAQAVASVLGVEEERGRSVVDALVEHVADRQLLLVLDNCEHLVGACAALAEQLLRSGPHVRILASSREPLRVSGEASFPVPALSVPASQGPVAVEALAQSPAVRLFVDRATAVTPAFRLTDRNAGAVAEICRHLDGIPLAIELAAARVRALSVETIAARLGDRFGLLTGGSRAALPRQQTLRALIDWSHDLLTEPERVLFRRLAVFAGSWTLEAAEAIGAGDGLQPGDVLDRLTALVDKSLVTLDPETGRYGLLGTIRDYAHERLETSGEIEPVRSRHLAFYLGLVERAKPELAGSNHAAWLARLDPERENLLAAHAWCDHAEGGADFGMRLGNAVKAYWFSRGLLGLGRRVTEEALARTGARQRNLGRCAMLAAAGQFAYLMGRYVEAEGHLRESVAIAREIGDRRRLAAALPTLGLAYLGQGNPAKAREHLEEALAVSRELGDKAHTAVGLNALAEFHRLQGNPDMARPLHEQVLALARELKDADGVATCLLNLAMGAIGTGSAESAREMLVEALAIAEEINSELAQHGALEISAGLAVLVGELEGAARFYGAAQAHLEQVGIRREPADEAFLAPLIARARAALGTVAFSAAEAAGRALSHEEAMAQAHAWLEQGSRSVAR